MQCRSLISILAILLPVSAVLAEPAPSALVHPEHHIPDPKGTFSFTWENDAVNDTDRFYTNGGRFAWVSPEDAVPGWLNNIGNHIPILDLNGNKRYSIAAGQNMYTPSTSRIAAPQFNDRPYAGWLYGSLGLLSDTGKTLDNFVLTLGVVGPLSKAEVVQNNFHKLSGNRRAAGWRYQLKNEPGVVLTYERKWRFEQYIGESTYGFDIIPQAAFNAGNIYTDATLGGIVRFGSNLTVDYGPPRIGPGMTGTDYFVPRDTFAWYIFGGVEGRAVARNIFLDGNSFRNSLDVDKEPFIGMFEAGIALVYGDARLSYTHVLISKEFEWQIGTGEQYGSLNLAYRF